ncbi:mCG1034277 [Mus musculus]|jgi:hypothetical protein|nr:mCG1034277 [Mus musculus]
MQHGVPGTSKTGLVIIVLCIIFIEDYFVSEEDLWHILNNMELYAGRDHIMHARTEASLVNILCKKGSWNAGRC